VEKKSIASKFPKNFYTHNHSKIQMNNILKKIKPSRFEHDHLHEELNNFLNKLNKQLTTTNAQAIMGGSIAKNTWLKNQHDIDIFVNFDYKKYKNKSAELSNILEKQLHKLSLDFKRLHGSRDYFQIKKESYALELIPVLEIKNSSQAVNITDVSLLHVKWVKEHLNENLADQVRLLKYYIKNLNLYGAESYIQGFSGYVLEILIIHYKSLHNVIEHAKKWKLKEVIDTEKYYKSREELFKNLSPSKTYSPLIIIDPVQKDRNAATSLSLEKFTKFIAYAQSFSLKQFEAKSFNLINIKKLSKQSNTDLFVLNLKTPDKKQDVVGSKLIKLIEHIKNEIQINDFRIYKHGWYWNKKDKALFYFLIYKDTLPKLKKHFGPPVWEHQHCTTFIDKYKDSKIHVENSRLFVELPRKYTKAKQLIKELFKQAKNQKI